MLSNRKSKSPAGNVVPSEEYDESVTPEQIEVLTKLVLPKSGHKMPDWEYFGLKDNQSLSFTVVGGNKTTYIVRRKEIYNQLLRQRIARRLVTAVSISSI
jgi:hypothetical protein